MKKSPIKFKGAGINMPQDLMPGQPQQQVTGGMQQPIQPITTPTQPTTPTPKTSVWDQQKHDWESTLPEFDVDAHNSAISNATTDIWGSKVYGAGAQFGSRRMGPSKTLSYDKAQTQQFTDYANLGMGGVTPGGINPAVGMRPTTGSQGYAERGAWPTTSAFAYKQKNSKSPLSFTGAAQAALGQRQQSGMGIFNPTGNDIAGFENQQAANKMAMNTNTYNQQAIPGEAWKQHQPFTGSGFETPLAQTKPKTIKEDHWWGSLTRIDKPQPTLNDPTAKASRVLSGGIKKAGDFIKSSMSALTGSIKSIFSSSIPSSGKNGGGPKVINQGTPQEGLVTKITNNNKSGGGKVLNQGAINIFKNKEVLRTKIN